MHFVDKISDIIISQICFRVLISSYELLEDRRIDDVRNILFGLSDKIDSMSPCVCSVIDHRRRENAVRTSEHHFFVLTTF